jgi:hypothetical protein
MRSSSSAVTGSVRTRLTSAYGLTGLGVLTSAAFLVICAVKICLKMVRE